MEHIITGPWMYIPDPDSGCCEGQHCCFRSEEFLWSEVLSIHCVSGVVRNETSFPYWITKSSEEWTKEIQLSIGLIMMLIFPGFCCWLVI